MLAKVLNHRLHLPIALGHLWLLDIHIRRFTAANPSLWTMIPILPSPLAQLGLMGIPLSQFILSTPPLRAVVSILPLASLAIKKCWMVSSDVVTSVMLVRCLLRCVVRVWPKRERSLQNSFTEHAVLPLLLTRRGEMVNDIN
jgi:hypothetical protein